MKILLYLLPVCWLLPAVSDPDLHSTPDKAFSAPAAFRAPDKSFFRFGDQLMTLARYSEAGEHPYVLVSLHSNETGVVSASLNFAQQRGIAFYELQNGGRKNVEASLLDQRVSFDPAQMFSSLGRHASLKANGCWGKLADEQLAQFSHFITSAVVSSKTVVSIHTTGWSMNDFTGRGRCARYARNTSTGTAFDARDFFVTNDEDLFRLLKAKGMNVVLQKAGRLLDDGSLQTYCIRQKKEGLHLEAGSGDASAVERMLAAVDEVLAAG